MIALPLQPAAPATSPILGETASLICSTFHRLGRTIPSEIQSELSSAGPNNALLRSVLFETIEQLSPIEQERLLYSRHPEAARLCEWWLANKQHRRTAETLDANGDLLLSILECEFVKNGFELNSIYRKVLKVAAVLLMDTERGVLPRSLLEDSVAELAEVDTMFALMVLNSALPKAQSIWSLSLKQAVGAFDFTLHSSWLWLRRHAHFVDSASVDSPGAVVLVLDRLRANDVPIALRPIMFVALQADVHHILIRKED